MDLTKVVAAKIHDTYYQFDRLETVPADGSKSLILGEELSELGLGRLSDVLELLGGGRVSFASPDQGVDAVVARIHDLPEYVPGVQVIPPKKRKNYERKNFSTFVFLEPKGVAKKELEKLAPQAQRVFELATRGAKSWPVSIEERELQQLMRDNASYIATKQDAYRIFQYYCALMIAHDLLRRV